MKRQVEAAQHKALIINPTPMRVKTMLLSVRKAGLSCGGSAVVVWPGPFIFFCYSRM